MVFYYICREHYTINALKSAEVVLNDDSTTDEAIVTLGDDGIDQSPSEVYLGVDRMQKDMLTLGPEYRQEDAQCTL